MWIPLIRAGTASWKRKNKDTIHTMYHYKRNHVQIMYAEMELI